MPISDYCIECESNENWNTNFYCPNYPIEIHEFIIKTRISSGYIPKDAMIVKTFSVDMNLIYYIEKYLPRLDALKKLFEEHPDRDRGNLFSKSFFHERVYDALRIEL